MKILIATEGKTLDSRVSKRFGKAEWYLIVDSDTKEVALFPNLTIEHHHDIIPRAVDRGVSAVITGDIGPQSFELLSYHKLQIALAHAMSARDAIERLKQGRLRILDAPTVRKNIEEHELLLKDRRDQLGRGKQSFRGRGAYAEGAAREHHHLQQYSGRGH
jgi:predicted Fe-Mo cluster-binding NifX family protein